jgi:hypothetical protein
VDWKLYDFQVTFYRSVVHLDLEAIAIAVDAGYIDGLQG